MKSIKKTLVFAAILLTSVSLAPSLDAASDEELLAKLNEYLASSGMQMSEEQKQQFIAQAKALMAAQKAANGEPVAGPSNQLQKVEAIDEPFHLSINGINYRLPQSCLLSREFGDDASKREFGDDAASREFGDDASKREFGDDAASRQFGDDASKREFGDDAASREFGDDASKREFGDDASKREFGDDASKREFGDDASKREFGDDASKREFGDDAAKREFGDDTAKREFGDDAATRQFGSDVNAFVCSYDAKSAQTTVFGLTGSEKVELFKSMEFKSIEQLDKKIVISF